ncbi:YPP1 [[Candida] subhashii]|uniref:YPP1 n=1 Tax=[Candida] subhashii TaxID=561895 RepID=A0A8J5QP89_9ASCO|nr:YPP1 [[Candida] subhashii]KAG7665154.1 YPP1 [[Candida] subhashii]
MHIENSINEKYIRTLNFGCFPKNILLFQDSQDYFQQLTFVDYQLQLLIEHEFKSDELLPVVYMPQVTEETREKLTSLISYGLSVSLNYENREKSYTEELYFAVIMAHLYWLDNNVQEMAKSLSAISVVNPNFSTTPEQLLFIKYLTCRYYVLLGCASKNSVSIWSDYLSQIRIPFTKSHVIASHWLDLLMGRLTFALSEGSDGPLSFINNIKHVSFFPNRNVFIAYCNYLLRPDNSDLINVNFKTEYSSFLTQEIEDKIQTKTPFPDAFSKDATINNYIYNLYESLSYVPFNLAILKPTLSKKFLVDASAKTYQSTVVLSNLIYTLIDLGEYDEALAAFKTYIEYIEHEQELNDGKIEDILAIIDTYSTCIIHFNPLKSFKNKELQKFKYNDDTIVVEYLKRFVNSLMGYLNTLQEFADLTYDDENDAADKNPLSFLYRRYNPSVLLSDHSQFIELISKAWYSMGYTYYYLSMYESPDQTALEYNVNQVLRTYKNSLIVNSTGNVLYLSSYVMALAHQRELKSAIKLCKFILKKYPESFVTWNLLVLLLTSFETNSPSTTKPLATNDPQPPQNGLTTNGDRPDLANSSINGTVDGQIEDEKPSVRESEKFINKALNIAGLFVAKHVQRDIKLTNEAKYEILQLKLTQLAVLESIHGVQYILDYLSDVFVLYHELFDVDLKSAPPAMKQRDSSRQFGTSERWSHRPSFIDPSPMKMLPPTPIKRSQTKIQPPGQPGLEPVVSNSSNIKAATVDRLKRISKINKNSSEGRRDSIVQSPTDKTAPATTQAIVKSPQQNTVERRILQEIWLWTGRLFFKVGLFDEAEQCILEAETIYEPNMKTFTALGYLTSKTRKFLSLQEFERSLEILNQNKYNKVDYGTTLLGLAKLFLLDDEKDNSLFISEKDLNSAIIRLKNMLEMYSLSWPYGYTNSEVWFYLSKIYEIIDDKIMLTKSLWKCVELEDFRPVRQFEICDHSLV